jgi:hypothetical protein
VDIPVNGVTTLLVSTAGGQISVAPGPEGNVHVDITRRAATDDAAHALAVTTSVSGEQVTVQWSGAAGDDSVSFAVLAPPSLSSVLATSGGGDLSAHDLSGTLRLRSAAGEITTSNTAGTLGASTGL